jgi:hypothetical protein
MAKGSQARDSKSKKASRYFAAVRYAIHPAKATKSVPQSSTEREFHKFRA